MIEEDDQSIDTRIALVQKGFDMKDVLQVQEFQKEGGPHLRKSSHRGPEKSPSDMVESSGKAEGEKGSKEVNSENSELITVMNELYKQKHFINFYFINSFCCCQVVYWGSKSTKRSV